MNKAKIKWARKLLKARYFVLLTDKASVIAFDGVHPDAFTDMLALSAQAAELEMFYNDLGNLIEKHKIALDKLERKSDGTANRKGRSTTSNTRGVQAVVRGHKTKKA